MKNVYKDIATGLLFIAGILGFLSGEFILSTVLFGASAVLSNLDLESVFEV